MDTGGLGALSGAISPMRVPPVTIPLPVSDEDDGKEVPSTLGANMLRVCTLHSAEAATAFQEQVGAMQAKLDAAVQLQEVLDAATEPSRINDARRALDSAMQEINMLNEAMVKAYGFSITRNYTMQINTSSLYVWATEDEVQGIAQVE